MSLITDMLRPFVHRFRALALRLLGIKATPRTVTERLERLMDRVLLLESHVNWRLHGAPANFGNVRLEQLALTRGTTSLRDLVDRLESHYGRSDEATVLGDWLRQVSPSPVVAIGSRALLGFQSEGRPVTLIADSDDLHSSAWSKDVPSGQRLVEAPPLAYLETQQDQTLAAVWFGDFMLRAQPLKALMTVQSALKKIHPSGFVGGYWKPQAGDPRVMDRSPLQALVALGIPSERIKLDGSRFRIDRQA